jgi:hypothetical protein
MKNNLITVLFFISLIAACATSEETDNINTSDSEEMEQNKKVDYLLDRDKEKIDSMKQILLKNIED